MDSVRVVLNGGAYSAIPRQDGSFKLHAVPPGAYLLEVMDTQSVWPTVRLQTARSPMLKQNLSQKQNPSQKVS